MRMTWCAGVAIMTAMLAGSASAETLKVSNEFLTASYDSHAGTMTLTAAGTDKPFASSIALSQAGGNAKVTEVADKTFGKCKAIEVFHADGGRDLVFTPAKLPFALFRSTVHNGAKEAAITNHIRPASFTLDLGATAGELKVLGTGGLAAAGNKPGSYMWMAVAEPKTRRGVVAGWITTDRGSGAVFAEEAGGAVRVTGQIDYGKLKIAPGADETLETLAVGYFDDARLGLEAWADAVAKVYAIHLPPILVGYCTWYHAGASDEKGLAKQAAFAAENLKKFGLDFDETTIPSLPKGRDVWLEMVDVCRASFALASIVAPPAKYGYGDTKARARFDAVLAGKPILKEMDRVIMHDAVLNTAMVWKNVWQALGKKPAKPK